MQLESHPEAKDPFLASTGAVSLLLIVTIHWCHIILSGYTLLMPIRTAKASEKSPAQATYCCAMNSIRL